MPVEVVNRAPRASHRCVIRVHQATVSRGGEEAAREGDGCVRGAELLRGVVDATQNLRDEVVAVLQKGCNAVQAALVPALLAGRGDGTNQERAG
jgi:hypothetical protein